MIKVIPLEVLDQLINFKDSYVPVVKEIIEILIITWDCLFFIIPFVYILYLFKRRR